MHETVSASAARSGLGCARATYIARDSLGRPDCCCGIPESAAQRVRACYVRHGVQRLPKYGSPFRYFTGGRPRKITGARRLPRTIDPFSFASGPTAGGFTAAARSSPRFLPFFPIERGTPSEGGGPRVVMLLESGTNPRRRRPPPPPGPRRGDPPGAPAGTSGRAPSRCSGASCAP